MEDTPGALPLVRRVAAEPATALLVQRALVMEVAHPKVAAAVADHSSFVSQPWRRALATADAATRIVFGDERTARVALARIRRTHDHVHGSVERVHGSVDHLHEPVEHAGGRYSAHDPTLLLWVWATLVDTAEVAYTRWVRPFEGREADAFHAEMRSLGRFLGIPEELLPGSRRELRAYIDGMLDGVELGSTRASRQLARQVLWFRHVLVPPAAVRLERSLALATLDRRLLDRLGLVPSAADAWVGWWSDGVLRTCYRHLPGARRLPLPLAAQFRHSTVDVLRRVGSGWGRRPDAAAA